METIQKPISENHHSAMFFDGLIATHNGFELKTYQDGEIQFMGNIHICKDIIDLGKQGLIDDSDFEFENTLDILVDKYIAVYLNDEIYDDYIFDNYDDAIETLIQL